jgi:hypothetical protein
MAYVDGADCMHVAYNGASGFQNEARNSSMGLSAIPIRHVISYVGAGSLSSVGKYDLTSEDGVDALVGQAVYPAFQMTRNGYGETFFGQKIKPYVISDGGSWTLDSMINLYIWDALKGSNVTITKAYGLWIVAPSAGTTNIPMHIEGLASYANNAAALAAGLVAGDCYRCGDTIGIVH